MLDVFLDALIDSLKTLPFLFAANFLIEYLEHRASSKMERGLQKLGKFGPIGGALLGVVPQCGFSVAAANFYAGRIITVGTLLAVFLSTSDEALPILFSHPEQMQYILPMLLIKVASGIVFGSSALIALDLVLKTGRSVGSAIEHARTATATTTACCTPPCTTQSAFFSLSSS